MNLKFCAKIALYPVGNAKRTSQQGENYKTLTKKGDCRDGRNNEKKASNYKKSIKNQEKFVFLPTYSYLCSRISENPEHPTT